MKEIYRGYSDTEVSEIVVNVKCPYCGMEWQEDNPECGVTYTLECEKDEWTDGCGKEFKMHFDAD